MKEKSRGSTPAFNINYVYYARFDPRLKSSVL